MVVSNDGNWLYDEELLSKGGSPEYAVIRRISTATGQTAQELAIPGDFKISQMAITTTAQVPQLYLIKSSPDCMVYVLDPSDQGPTVSGLIDLGGVEGASGVVFTGTVSLGPTNGTQLYATQNISADNGTITGQDLWLLDTQAMTVEAHLLDNSAAGSVLANPTDHYTAAPFILRNGVVLLAPNSLQGEIVPWLSLSDGHPILALLAVGNNQ
jgi:hypothetical protein